MLLSLKAGFGVLAEITRAAYELESYKQIMGVIARRLQDQGEDWRHVYKSLLLLEYMSKHGPQKVRSPCRLGCRGRQSWVRELLGLPCA